MSFILYSELMGPSISSGALEGPVWAQAWKAVCTASCLLPVQCVCKAAGDEMAVCVGDVDTEKSRLSFLLV